MRTDVAARRADGDESLGPEGFEAFVNEQADGLFRFALSLTRDHDRAEDLVQETFVRAYERRATFRGESSAGTWLRRILHNLAVDRARRSEREVLVDEVEDRWRDESYTVDATAVVERAEIRDELEDALVRLPFIYRSAVVLHDAEGWTMTNVAATLGIGLPAAKQRLRRGRMMLITALASTAERRVALQGVPLRCWDARRRISDYLDRELEPAEADLVERHLAGCPTCPPLYASLVGVQARLGGLRDPDSVVPPTLSAKILARLA